MKERDFQRQVVDLARLTGWWVMHHLNSRGTTPGWPDLTLIRGHRLEFIELKTDTGRVTVEQRDVHARLLTAGHEVHVLRPGDWACVVELLQREGA